MCCTVLCRVVSCQVQLSTFHLWPRQTATTSGQKQSHAAVDKEKRENKRSTGERTDTVYCWISDESRRAVVSALRRGSSVHSASLAARTHRATGPRSADRQGPRLPHIRTQRPCEPPAKWDLPPAAWPGGVPAPRLTDGPWYLGLFRCMARDRNPLLCVQRQGNEQIRREVPGYCVLTFTATVRRQWSFVSLWLCCRNCLFHDNEPNEGNEPDSRLAMQLPGHEVTVRNHTPVH